MSAIPRGLRSPERDLARELQAKGWTFKQLRNGHVRALHPGGVGSVVFPSTSSDWRSYQNLRSDVRRIERAAKNG